MKKIITTILIGVCSLFAYSQTDSTKVIYPIGEITDTLVIWGCVMEVDKPLIVKEYNLVVYYWVFGKEIKKEPKPYKNQLFDKAGVLQVFNDKRRFLNLDKK